MLEHFFTKSVIIALIGVGLTIAITARHILSFKRDRTITEINRVYPYVKHNKSPQYKQY